MSNLSKDKINIIYVRMQDFDKRFYVSSEREICRSFFKAGNFVELIGIGTKKDEPEFVRLFSAFNKNPTIIKAIVSVYLLKYLFTKSVIVFDNLGIICTFPILILRSILGGKARLLIDIRSIPVETTLQSEYIKYRRAMKFAAKFYNGFTFITEGTRRVTEEMSGVKYNNYEVYPSGVNTDIMAPLPRDNDLKRKYGIKESKLVLFYHGSLSKNRGVVELLDAVEAINKENRPLLLIVGGGDQEITERLNNSEDAIYTGVVSNSEIPKFIALADICVSPLPDIIWWRVASALKVVEYMACGKCVILTKMEAHTNTVPEGTKGIEYIDKLNAKSLSTAIENIRKKMKDEPDCGEFLRNYAEENYSYDFLALKLLKYYDKLYYKH